MCPCSYEVVPFRKECTSLIQQLRTHYSNRNFLFQHQIFYRMLYFKILRVVYCDCTENKYSTVFVANLLQLKSQRECAICFIVVFA